MKHSILYPRLRATAAALALALVAAGCAVGPDYQKPQSAPVTLASPEQALFSNGQLQRDWWKQLQDPQLDRLIGLALERNHDIRIAQARLAESRAVLDERAGPAADRHGRRPLRAQPVADQSRPRGRAQSGQELSRRLRRVLGNRPVRPAAPGRRERGRAQPGAGRRSGAGPHRGRRRVARNYFELRGAEQRLAVARANLRTRRTACA